MSGGILETMGSRRRKHALSGRVVKAEPLKDSSYMESMVSFLQDIGQAYSNSSQIEEREAISWVEIFDYVNILSPELPVDYRGQVGDAFEAILLVLGYKNGIQVWTMEKSGEAHEILSLRQGPVKTVCLLPAPLCDDLDELDKNDIARPLLAVCLAADRKQLFTSIRILSLRTGDEVHHLKFEFDIERIHTSMKGMMAITFKHEVQVYDTKDFEKLLTIKDCYLSPGANLNPIAVCDEWLAYSPSKIIPEYLSAGGKEVDGINSYAAKVINVANTIQQGISETVNWLAKTGLSGSEEYSLNPSRDNTDQRSRSTSAGSQAALSDEIPGLITVLNIPTLCRLMKDNSSTPSPEERIVNGIVPKEAVVAHFSAHKEAIACSSFSARGSLLATADRLGHAFHVFSILPHPLSPALCAVHHLYTLYRGDTSATVLQMTFSCDRRWLCASTQRGTTHVFPISTYGGTATNRTHVSHRVVNRASLFHKSAGLEDIVEPSPAGSGAIGGEGPNSANYAHRSRFFPHGSRIHNSTNPRLPPHPQPTLVQPLVQIGAARTKAVLNLPKMTAQTGKSDKSSMSNWHADYAIASVFLSGMLGPSNSPTGCDKTKNYQRVPMSSATKGGQCLLIFTSSGVLTEYHLQPRPQSGLTKISDDSPIELTYRPKFQWCLQRLLTWEEITLPLRPTNPLLEIDNLRRQFLKLEKPESALSSSSSSESTSGKNLESSNKPEVDCNGVKLEDVPKTQQPTSRFPGTGKPVNIGKYPGMPIPGMKPILNDSPQDSTLFPTTRQSDHAFQPRSLPSLDDVENVKAMSIARRRGSDASDRRPLSRESLRSDKNPNLTRSCEWAPQVEIESHDGPTRRLWMGPQFHFKTRLSSSSTMILSSTSSSMFATRQQTSSESSSKSRSTRAGSINDTSCLGDDLDVRPLDIHPPRSDPVPTPKYTSSYGFEPSSLTIEAGSGNFDRASLMLEHYATFGSAEDYRNGSLEGVEKLREEIAEAMQDSFVPDIKKRALRTESDSSDTVEYHGSPDTLLTVGEFDFEDQDETS